MLAIVQGLRGQKINILRETDKVLNGVLMNDDGSELDITGHTVTLEVYKNKSRSDTPTSLAAALVTAAAGTFTVTIADDDLLIADFPAGDYYAWVKRDNAGDIELSKEYVILALG